MQTEEPEEDREATPSPRTPIESPARRTRDWVDEHEPHTSEHLRDMLQASRDKDVVIGAS